MAGIFSFFWPRNANPNAGLESTDVKGQVHAQGKRTGNVEADMANLKLHAKGGSPETGSWNNRTANNTPPNAALQSPSPPSSTSLSASPTLIPPSTTGTANTHSTHTRKTAAMKPKTARAPKKATAVPPTRGVLASPTRSINSSPRGKGKARVSIELPTYAHSHSRSNSHRSNSPAKMPPSPASIRTSDKPPSFSGGEIGGFIDVGASNELKQLLKSVPPKTLHTYLTSRLSRLPPSDLISLSHVLSELEPPPVLHCVRCHKPFTEVENTAHSCLVEHDDESAFVQPSKGAKKGAVSNRETFFGCCGRTVEGKGELGPPDGWCYEGFHTVDRKRARWRDDSTVEDDKLASCEEKGCFREKLLLSPRRGRDRGKKRIREDDDEEGEDNEEGYEASVGKFRRPASISPSALSVRSTRSARRRAVSPALSHRSARRQPSPTPSIEMSPPPSELAAASSKKKAATPKKPRSRAGSVASTSRGAGGGPPKSKAKSRMKQVLMDAVESASVSSSRASESETEPVKKSKKRRVS